jgi:cytochrome b involved in lipid metabolism
MCDRRCLLWSKWFLNLLHYISIIFLHPYKHIHLQKKSCTRKPGFRLVWTTGANKQMVIAGFQNNKNRAIKKKSWHLVNPISFVNYIKTLKMPVYNLEQVQQHNTKGDLWMVLHNKVYDVSKFAEEVKWHYRLLFVYLYSFNYF